MKGNEGGNDRRKEYCATVRIMVVAVVIDVGARTEPTYRYCTVVVV
jgi:hypothetical protein